MKYDDLNVVVLAYSRFEFFEKVFKVVLLNAFLVRSDQKGLKTS